MTTTELESKREPKQPQNRNKVATEERSCGHIECERQCYERDGIDSIE